MAASGKLDLKFSIKPYLRERFYGIFCATLSGIANTRGHKGSNAFLRYYLDLHII